MIAVLSAEPVTRIFVRLQRLLMSDLPQVGSYMN